MAPYETLLVEEAGDDIRIVTLNRPQSLNALNNTLVNELHDLLDGLQHDHSCRAVVLTGAGRGFCAGLDISNGFGMLEGTENQGRVASGFAVQERIASVMTKMTQIPQPIVAAVNGPAAGGGLALALASDTRVCGPTARFNAAFIRIGVSGCDVGVSYFLPRTVGPTLAFEMMLTGRLIDAEEAHRAGMVLRVVEAGGEVEAALDVARAIVRNSPFGVRMTKQVMWTNLSASSLQAAVDLENRTQILTAQTADSLEAMRSFLEKRPPQFEDR